MGGDPDGIGARPDGPGSREPSPSVSALPGFDPSRYDIAALRESCELENQADLMAAACNFGEASRLMKAANKLRAGQFGQGFDPNQLRALTAIATEARRAETENTGSVEDDGAVPKAIAQPLPGDSHG